MRADTARCNPSAPHAPPGFGASFLVRAVPARVVECTQSVGPIQRLIRAVRVGLQMVRVALISPGLKHRGFFLIVRQRCSPAAQNGMQYQLGPAVVQ